MGMAWNLNKLHEAFIEALITAARDGVQPEEVVPLFTNHLAAALQSESHRERILKALVQSIREQWAEGDAALARLRARFPNTTD